MVVKAEFCFGSGAEQPTREAGSSAEQPTHIEPAAKHATAASSVQSVASISSSTEYISVSSAEWPASCRVCNPCHVYEPFLLLRMLCASWPQMYF